MWQGSSRLICPYKGISQPLWIHCAAKTTLLRMVSKCCKSDFLLFHPKTIWGTWLQYNCKFVQLCWLGSIKKISGQTNRRGNEWLALSGCWQDQYSLPRSSTRLINKKSLITIYLDIFFLDIISFCLNDLILESQVLHFDKLSTTSRGQVSTTLANLKGLSANQIKPDHALLIFGDVLS